MTRCADFVLRAQGDQVPPAVAVEASDDLIIQLPTGDFLLLPSGDSVSEGAPTIRILRPNGEEAVMWESAEWGEDPSLVMGAIWGAILNGPLGGKG